MSEQRNKESKDDAPRCSAAVLRISGDMQCLKRGSYKCGGCGRPLCGQHCNPTVLQACAKGKHQDWSSAQGAGKRKGLVTDLKHLSSMLDRIGKEYAVEPYGDGSRIVTAHGPCGPHMVAEFDSDGRLTDILGWGE